MACLVLVRTREEAEHNGLEAFINPIKSVFLLQPCPISIAIKKTIQLLGQ